MLFRSVSPGVGASWASSSGSSLNLVKSMLAGSETVKSSLVLSMSWGLNSASVWSMEKITDFSSISLKFSKDRVSFKVVLIQAGMLVMIVQ